MSRFYIGIDTSNYTTSAALYDAESGTFLSNVKHLLTVSQGERGLRQQDALFAHVKNLPEVTAEAFSELAPGKLAAIGASATPRDNEGSYMPCFLAGKAAASSLSAAFHKPLYLFSHQAGHVMAAVYSSKSRDLLSREFLAFHVSGGTTELLHIVPRDDSFQIEKIGGTLDLNAGQAIDRAGVMMGLSFPCGPALEKLALACTEKPERPQIAVRGCDCNLSGLENKVDGWLKKGDPHEKIARSLFDFVGRTLMTMAENALAEKGALPILFAGGVMSNALIKKMIAEKGFDARFAEPKFSSDNAAGCALLTARKGEGDSFWTA